jgi:hypothetical protein
LSSVLKTRANPLSFGALAALWLGGSGTRPAKDRAVSGQTLSALTVWFQNRRAKVLRERQRGSAANSAASRSPTPHNDASLRGDAHLNFSESHVASLPSQRISASLQNAGQIKVTACETGAASENERRRCSSTSSSRVSPCPTRRALSALTVSARGRAPELLGESCRIAALTTD